VEAFAAHIHTIYLATTQIKPAVYVTAPSSGAGTFEP